VRLLNRLSIRARITIGTFLLAGIFFAGVAAVVRHQVENILENATYDVLRADAAPFETAIQQEPGEPIDSPGEDQLVAVIDPKGTTAQSTLPASLEKMIDSIRSAPEGRHTIDVSGTEYLVQVEGVEAADGTWTIISARSGAASEIVLMNLTTGLFVGLAALTLIFGGVSWLLTGASLRPVSRLRASAETLAVADSDRLLPVGPAHDEITDLATTLNKLIGELRASADREKQIVSDASHELRTPLSILQAQLELMRTGDRSSLDSDIVAAENAVRRLARLVSDLLELSRLDAQSSTATATITEIIAEAGQAIDRARTSAANQTIAIDYAFPTGVETDQGEIETSAVVFGRIIDNLLNNAVTAVTTSAPKNAEPGSIALRITVTDAELQLTVSDTGPGMDTSFIPHALDRFSQEDSSRGASTGAGLGLAIVAAAVQRASGTVEIRNRAERGLEVSITLPILPKPPHVG
jgi:two-component system OmpR family sensor kinase